MNEHHSRRFQPEDFRRWIPHESRNTRKAKKRKSSLERQCVREPIGNFGRQICKLLRQSTAYDGNGTLSELKKLFEKQGEFEHTRKQADIKPEVLSSEEALTTMLFIEKKRSRDRANAKREERMMVEYVDNLLDEIQRSYYSLLDQ